MNRWNVLPSTIRKPSASTSALSRPFTVALVASGTNAGVSTSPCAHSRTPARAEPSRASIRKPGGGATRGSLEAAGATRSAGGRRAAGAGRRPAGQARPAAGRRLLPLACRALDRGGAGAVLDGAVAVARGDRDAAR